MPLSARRLRATLIGDRAFYKLALTIAVPMIIQNTTNNFVSLLDNIMIGQVGTAEMAGVAIANQIFFVFYLCIFGAISGAGIFGAQFYGAGDYDGVRNAFRFKLLSAIVLLAAGLTLFLCFGDRLIRMYLQGDGDAVDAEAMFTSARSYMQVMLWGLLPNALSVCYASTLREAGESKVPMKASITAVLCNFLGNWLLIFGNLGFPVMGVRGAAVATVISRFIELTIIAVHAHRHTDRYAFVRGLYRSIRIPRRLVRSILIKGTPLLVNETLWAFGMAMLTRAYSLRGLNVMPALNIASTVSNMFNVVFLSMGTVVAVLVGQALGANDVTRAKSTAWKLMALSVSACFIMGGLLAAASPFIPRLYNTAEDVRQLSTRMILTGACCMPMFAFAHCCYFTLRSGGRTVITFFFDSVYSWTVCIPLAFLLVYKTAIPIQWLYFCCQAIEVVKCAVGFILIRKGVWIRNIIGGTAAMPDRQLRTEEASHGFRTS